MGTRAAMLPGPTEVDRSYTLILSCLTVLFLPTPGAVGKGIPILQAGNPHLLRTDILSWCCLGFFTFLLVFIHPRAGSITML